MNKDKLKKLNDYKSKLIDSQNNPTPAKHKDHTTTYKQYLENEIRIVNLQIESETVK